MNDNDIEKLFLLLTHQEADRSLYCFWCSGELYRPSELAPSDNATDARIYRCTRPDFLTFSDSSKEQPLLGSTYVSTARTSPTLVAYG
jgi:hypothetical protein